MSAAAAPVTRHGLCKSVPDQEAAAEGQRGEERGGAAGGAQVPGVQHLERRARAVHRTKGAREVQDANPGHDTPDTGNLPGADDRGAETIPHRVARLLRLLPNPACAHDSRSVDSPKITLVSLAAVADRSKSLQGIAPPRGPAVQCSDRRWITDGLLAHVGTPGGPTSPAQSLFRLTRSPQNSMRPPAASGREFSETPNAYASWRVGISQVRFSTTSYIRTFLRFLRWSDLNDQDLALFVPRTPCWRLAHLPPRLAWEDVRRAIDAIDVTTPSGVRDRALLLLLATTGFRRGVSGRTGEAHRDGRGNGGLRHRCGWRSGDHSRDPY